MTESQIKLKRTLDDINRWGILTLMTKMKDAYLKELKRDRDIILGYQTQKYKDSPLENLDKIEQAFKQKFQEEFAKIYNRIEKEYNERSTKNPRQTKQDSL